MTKRDEDQNIQAFFHDCKSIILAELDHQALKSPETLEQLSDALEKMFDMAYAGGYFHGKWKSVE